MLSASILPLGDSQFESRSIEAIKAGANFIHFDVVEGKKGKTQLLEENSIDTVDIQTPKRLREIKEAGKKIGLEIPIDVHLIVMEPSESYIKEFLDAGANIIFVHWESFDNKKDLINILKFIKNFWAKAGIAIRPDVDINEFGKFVETEIDYIDAISQTSIYPCYNGQSFIYSVLKNIKILRNDFNFNKIIAVDGGVSGISAKKSIQAGANFLIAGSAFFGSGDRTFNGLKIASRKLRETNDFTPDLYDLIVSKILELYKKKKDKLWIKISGYHGGGKTFFAEIISEKLNQKDNNLKIILFGQDKFWSARKEREKRKEEDSNYYDGMSHLRLAELDIAIKNFSDNVGKVTIKNIYDFDSGETDKTEEYDIKTNSIIIVEGCYADVIKHDFDFSIFIKTNSEKAKQRAMQRDAIKVHRNPEDTKELYEKVYEKTYLKYLENYSPEKNANIIINSEDIENPLLIYSRPALKLLECISCKKQFPIEIRIEHCPFCGGHLEFDIKGDVDFEKSIVKQDSSMWRYKNILPVEDKFIVSAGEGNTPVIYLEDLSAKYGIELYAKLESENPTGTFKDREASFVISRTKQLNQDNIVFQSTGNTGLAITYYSGLANLKSYFFGPLVSKYKMLIPDKAKNSKIILIDGEPIDVKAAAADFALVNGFPKISPFYERCEANSTLGYEIAENILNKKLPNFDFYVQTIAAGMGPIGFFTGMKRVSKWTNGKIKSPRIVAVQISEFSPIQEAWEADAEQVGPKGLTPKFASKEPFEPTLHTTNAPSYYPFLRRLLKDSNGILTKVEPDEVNLLKDEFEKSLNKHKIKLTNTENSSFVGYAGLIQQIKNGNIPKYSKVLLLVTGKGLKNYIKAKPDAIIPKNYNVDLLVNEFK